MGNNHRKRSPYNAPVAARPPPSAPSPATAPVPTGPLPSPPSPATVAGPTGPPPPAPLTPAATSSSTFGRVFNHPIEDVRDTYALGPILGRGQFGVTRLVAHRHTGEHLACKTIPTRKLLNGSNMDSIRREVQILHHLTGHRNIVELRGVYEDRKAVHLVMELCEGGELFDRIIEHGCYSERAAAGLCRQIASMVHNCHSMRVMHRDIKPENFLCVGKEEDSPLKAIDFGLSHFFKPASYDDILV